MVLFYSYNAGVRPVDTQYFLGVYVLVTFVMVFLTYPMTNKSAPGQALHQRTSFMALISASGSSATGSSNTPT